MARLVLLRRFDAAMRHRENALKRRDIAQLQADWYEPIIAAAEAAIKAYDAARTGEGT